MKKILFGARDPAAANVLFPVIKKLEDIDFKVLASKESKQIFSDQKIDYVDVDSGFDVDRLFDEFNPDLVVTGPSVGKTVEREIVILAKKKGIKSVSILDFWMNYWQRYSDLDSGEKFVYLPDYIFVMDDMAKQDMVKEGFPGDKLIVTGNPYFDTFENFDFEGDYVLYVSQPRPDLSDDQVKFFPNYNVINDLIEVLDEKLIVRLHPKDNIKDFKQFNNENVTVDIDTDIFELVKNANLVVGINSTVLFQAALSGKLVISYQNGLEEDKFIGKRLGICYSAYDKTSFQDLVRKALDGKLEQKSVDSKLDKGSTERVLKHIYSLI